MGSTKKTQSKQKRRKDIIKMREETNDNEHIKIIEKINETKSQFCKQVNKINRPLARLMGTLVAQDRKESAYSAGNLSSTPGSGGSPGGGHGNPLQYSCLENAMDREAWRVTDHGVAKTQLSN